MEEHLTAYEFTSLIYQRFDHFQTLWIIYTTGVIGVVSILITFNKHLNSLTARIIMIVMFWLFTWSNLDGLIMVQKDRFALQEIAKYEINGAIGADVDIYRITANKKLMPSYLICVFHTLQSLFVTLLIILLPETLVSISKAKSIGNREIKIRGSTLPNPNISWDQQEKIWRLESDVRVKLILSGNEPKEVFISKGFTFDLASVPKFLWWFIAPFELSIIAPLVHDFIYVNKGNLILNENQNFMESGVGQKVHVSRKMADLIFLEHMEQEDVKKFKRYACYYMIRLFGRLYWWDKGPSSERKNLNTELKTVN